MADQTLKPDVLHQMKNYLSVIVGFSEILLDDLPATDPRHADLKEMRRAALGAMDLLPHLSQRL